MCLQWHDNYSIRAILFTVHNHIIRTNNSLTKRRCVLLKRSKILICFILVVLLMCCACGKSEPKVLFISDAVLMDSQNITESAFVICFDYLYKGKLPEFEVISIDGEGLDNTTYTNEDVTSDFELDVRYDGYKMGAQCVEIEYDKNSIGKTMTVNAINFRVDGVEKSLNLEYPLNFTPLSEDVNAGFLWGSQIINSCGVDSEIAFAYTAGVDVTVNSFSIGKYAELDKLTISLDEDSDGEVDRLVGGAECLPLKISKGSTVIIRGKVASKYYTGYQNIYTTSVLRYSYLGNDYEQHHAIFIEGVSDEVFVHPALKYILDNDLGE